MKDAKLITGIGEIVLSVYRTTQIGMEEPLGRYNRSERATPKEIAEKALKGQALSHGVVYVTHCTVLESRLTSLSRFGATATIHKPLTREISYTDGPNNPLAVFVFKYRSRGGHENLIIQFLKPTMEINLSLLTMHY